MPFGDILMSVFVNVDEMVLPDISIDLPVESCPIMSYNSSKLLLILSIAVRNESPVPVFTPDPVLILCLDMCIPIYFTEKLVPHPHEEWAFGLSYVKYDPKISCL